jgi:thiazole synthase ThiGH ThiG subunit
MAYAMQLGVLAGRAAFQAGKIDAGKLAQPSSPIVGLSKK